MSNDKKMSNVDNLDMSLMVLEEPHGLDYGLPSNSANHSSNAEVAGLDAGVSDEWVNLKCSEGDLIKIHRRATNLSGMLKGLLQTNPNAPEIEIKQIDKETLQKIVEYLEHYRDKEPVEIQRPLPTNDLKDVTNEWDAKFVDYDKSENVEKLLKLMLAANFMDIHSLRLLTCAKFATFIRTKNNNDLKQLLGIPLDAILTPQQEQDIRKKYPEYFAWLKPQQE